MRIRYTPPRELSISGTAQELEEVRQQLLYLAGTPNATDTLHFSAQTDGDPTPYAQWLDELTIARAPGPVSATVVNDVRLEIAGAPDMLGVFASYWEFAPDASSGTHNHHEYYDGSETVAPESLPLVIEVE